MKLGEKPNMPHPDVDEASKTCCQNNDAPSIMKYGFLVQPNGQIVALHVHCAKGAPHASVFSNSIFCT